MMRLVRVELSRLLHRRAVLLLAVAAIIVPAVIGVVTVLDTRPASDAEVAAAKEQLERDRRSMDMKREIRRCVEDRTYMGMPENLSDKELRVECRRQLEPQLDWYLWSPRLDLADEADAGSGLAVAMVLAIAMLLAGTTFTGHDWASGSVSNQLLFEPRRLRVWLAKAAAVTSPALLLSVVVMSSYWLALGAVARSRGLLPDGVLLDCLQMGMRAAAIAAGAALLGFALTMLFRSTVATLGILMAVALAGGTVLGALAPVGPWNPAYSVAAVLQDGTTYSVVTECTPAASGLQECTEERTITAAEGSTYIGSALVLCGAASVLSFRRRDVP